MVNDRSAFQPYLPELYPELPTNGFVNLEANAMIEEFADRLAAETNQSLPVNVRELAKYLGIMRIDDGHPFYVRGLLNTLADVSNQLYYRALIRADMGENEKRTTIAHEMGHVALHILGLENVRQEEEELSDRFARAVLLPRRLVKQITTRGHPFEIFADAFEKTGMEEEYVLHRLVKDLRVMRGYDAFVWIPRRTDGKNGFEDYGSVISRYARFPTIGRYGSVNQVDKIDAMMIFDSLGRYLWPHTGKIYSLKDVYSEDWFGIFKKRENLAVYPLTGDAVTFGESMEISYAGTGEKPEFAICGLNIGKMVAEAADLKYFNDIHILRRAVPFYKAQ